jgi:hypothetical protein
MQVQRFGAMGRVGMLAIATLGIGLSWLAATPKAEARDYDLNRILASSGLVSTGCMPGVVEIKVSGNLGRSACAVPTAQYPAGLYVLNQEDYSISPVGVRQQAPAVYPSPVFPVTTPIAVPTAPTVVPAILVQNSPSQYVSPDISAQITASLMGKGLTPVSCSANPGVTVLIGNYLACAYPTATFPPGRYSMR